MKKMYLSLHRDRKQLLQQQQSVLSVQMSVADLRQELQARARLLQVGTPRVFTWLLCVTDVTLGGTGLGLGDCAEGGDLLRSLQSVLGDERDFQAVAVITDQGWKKGPMGGREPGREKEAVRV